MATFERTRPAVGARAVGVARAAYDYALEYARQRVQFGRPIIENQAIAFLLADLKTSIDAARLLVWRAAWMARNGQQFTGRGPGSAPANGPAPAAQRIWTPEMVRAMTSRWISEVPSKIV